MNALAFAACALAACGGGDGADADAGTLEVTAIIAPDPPQVGQNTLRIEVRRRTGEPVTGASVTVDPEMPSMGHGTTEDAVVEERGDGRYDAFPVTFFMPGDWEVRIRADGIDEYGTQVYDYRPQ